MVFYNGLETRYGKLKNTPTLNIKLGKDLTSFEYGVTMKPAIPDYLFYNYTQNHQFEKKTKVLNPGGVNGYTLPIDVRSNTAITDTIQRGPHVNARVGGKNIHVNIDIETGRASMTPTEAARIPKGSTEKKVLEAAEGHVSNPDNMDKLRKTEDEARKSRGEC